MQRLNITKRSHIQNSFVFWPPFLIMVVKGHDVNDDVNEDKRDHIQIFIKIG